MDDGLKNVDYLRFIIDLHTKAFGVPTLVGLVALIDRIPTKVGTPNAAKSYFVRNR